MRIDHVLFAARDLDAAAERMRALALDVRPGGRHDGIGTQNRIVPLGRGYLELIAVADAAEAAANPIGRRVAAADGLMGWAVGVEDVAPHAARLGLAVTRIGRQGLTATLAGVAEAMADPSVPFFIARDLGVAEPSAGGRGGGIARLVVRGDAERTRTWLGGADLPVALEPGPPAVVALELGDGATIR